MNKKLIFTVLSIMLSISCFAQNQLKLENDKVLAVFDPANGSLIRLVNKETNWNVINRPQLGQSFEMLVPLKERRYHRVNGKEQAAPTVEKTGNSISFTWKSLKSKYMDRNLDITFKGTITLSDEGLLYSGETINNDEYPIEYLAWPFLGELSVPDKQKNLVCQGKNVVRNLYPNFFSEHGYWGVEYPTNLSLLPENAFLLIRNDNQGIYVFSEQTTPEQMLIGSFELIPGFDLPGLNPTTDTMDGQLVRMQFKANHTIYAQPKSNVRLKPLRMEFYKGDWQKGADRYKKWKQGLSSAQTGVDWIKQPLTWRKISISSGQELINYAREAKEYGVSALLVNGWMRMANQSPYIETVSDFASALEECKKLEVKVVLEMNLTGVDFRSAWYKNELKDQVMTDPFGWAYDRRNVCPASNDLREILEQEYSKHPEILSADGMICDDNNHRGKSFFCFNPNHGHAVPAFADKSIIELDRHFSGLAKQYGSNFATMGYGLLDIQTTFYDGYFINSPAPEQALQRYINPETSIIAPVDVRTARQDMNLSLKNRLNICYDLRFYSNQLKTYPHIMTYGQQIEKLRNQYKDFIWNGVFSDVLGASVKGDNLLYSVYNRKSDGKKAVIIVNRSENKTTAAQVTIDNSKSALVMASPENLQAVACNGTVTIQPLSAVVIIEK